MTIGAGSKSCVIQSGKALDIFRKMIELHGGNPKVIDDYRLLPFSTIKEDVTATQAGTIAGVDAEQIGRACLILGAGRKKTDDVVDFAVGVSGLLKIGEKVGKGDRLAIIHANDEAQMREARHTIESAFTISEDSTPPPPLVTDMILPGAIL